MIIYSSETSVCFTCVEFYLMCCDNWFLHKASQNVSSIDLCMRHPVACCGKLQLWYTCQTQQHKQLKQLHKQTCRQ